MAEMDPDFAPFRAKWRERISMSDDDALHAYMRVEKAKAAPRVEMKQEPGKTGIFVEVDGRGFGATADPGAIIDMIGEWEAKLAEHRPIDERAFTKQYISHIFGHGIETGNPWSEVICAVVWLASKNPGALSSLSQGDVTLDARFSFDDTTRNIRVKLALLLPSASSE